MKEGKKRKERRGEGPAVQLNCYDIIRGDPSGTGYSGSALARGGERAARGRGMGAARTQNCDESWNCRRKPFILRLRPVVPFDQFIQGFKAFPRARPSWLCLVSPLFPFFSNSRAAFPRLPIPPASLPATTRNPNAAQRRCSRCTYAIRRHVSAIFCAADGSCRDRPTNASNIPAHRVLPSRGVFPERDTFWPGVLFSPARDPCRLIMLTRHLLATRANRMHASAWLNIVVKYTLFSHLSRYF